MTLRLYRPIMWECECGIKCTDKAAHNEWHRVKEEHGTEEPKRYISNSHARHRSQSDNGD